MESAPNRCPFPILLLKKSSLKTVQLLLLLFLGSSISTIHISDVSKEYVRNYYGNGTLKSEGWLDVQGKQDYWKFYYENGEVMQMGHFNNNLKRGYWYFYTSNGILEKEGHFIDGKMNLWWLFYDVNGQIDHKCQLKNGQKNGYCLKYDHEEITSAEKYRNGTKIKEWFDFDSFRKENKLSDLR